MHREHPTPGLRERKKLATRSALSEAALRLAVERGLDRVRVEDIAAEAGVSPRTFNDYFSSKGEAVVGAGVDRAARVRAALQARPADEPLWQALSHAVTERYPDDRLDPAWVAKARLVKATPALTAERLRSEATVERELAGAIAERTGTDIDRDLYQRLVAAAIVSATHVALDHWLDTAGTGSLRSTLTHALQQVAAGLPAPTTHGVR